jgi:hypothetical protein
MTMSVTAFRWAGWGPPRKSPTSSSLSRHRGRTGSTAGTSLSTGWSSPTRRSVAGHFDQDWRKIRNLESGLSRRSQRRTAKSNMRRIADISQIRKNHRKCEGFRTTAHCDSAGRHRGRRPKASREGTREQVEVRTAPRAYGDSIAAGRRGEVVKARESCDCGRWIGRSGLDERW